MEGKVILSSRGKVSWGRAAAIGICVLAFLALGIFMARMYTNSGRERERFVLFAMAFFSFAICIIAVVQFMMQQRSFLELTDRGVYGAAYSSDAKSFTITPPRHFELNYSDIQRVDLENGFVLLVTSSGTYRCRAASMGQLFVSEIKRQRGV